MKVVLSALVALLLPLPVLCDQVVRIQKKPALSYSTFSTAALTSLAQRGVSVLDDYGPFATAVAGDGVDLAAVGTSADLTLIPEPDAYRLDSGTTTIDIRSPEKALTGVPQDLQVTDYSGPIGLYLVKFRGPIRPGWTDPLEQAGVRLIQYVHKDGYIVAAPSGLSALKALVGGPIVYVGVNQPYFKLAPGLRTVAALDGGASRIRVLFDRGRDLSDVSAQIRSFDPAATIDTPSGVGDPGAELTATAAQWRQLARHSAVLAIEPGIHPTLSDERVDQVIAHRRDGSGIPTLPGTYKSWLAGLCGGACGDLSGEIVDVMDSGIPTNPPHQDLDPARFPSSRIYFGIPTLDDDCWHGTFVSGMLAGDPSLVGGTGLLDQAYFYYDMGVAPTVHLHPSRVFTGNCIFGGALTTGILDQIIGNAYSDGARYQNASWNMPTYTYDSIAREYDILVRQPMLSRNPDNQITAVVSAGNYPWDDPATTFVETPATAKNVIAVSASAIQRGADYGGNLGGTCDTLHGITDLADFGRQAFYYNSNRLKPDLFAPGQSTSSARAPNILTWYSNCAGDPNVYLPAQPPRTGQYYPGDGTSFSAPVVTGAAVLAKKKIVDDTKNLQGWKNITVASPALIKATLINTAESNYGGHNYLLGYTNTWEPTPYQGWGRVALSSLFEDPVSKAYLDEDHAMTPTRRFTQTGAYQNFSFTVADPSKAISATLVISDAPASVGASVTRVNEVDMYVLQSGYIYCDGQYSGQYATRSTTCPLPDMDNNVKRTRIAPNSFTGQFTIQLVAGSVAAKAVPARDRGPNQDWALYVYNAIPNY